MDDEDVIEAERRTRREHARFFSNSAKPERERWEEEIRDVVD
jgi:hypothetical protein